MKRAVRQIEDPSTRTVELDLDPTDGPPPLKPERNGGSLDQEIFMELTRDDLSKREKMQRTQNEAGGNAAATGYVLTNALTGEQRKVGLADLSNLLSSGHTLYEGPALHIMHFPLGHEFHHKSKTNTGTCVTVQKAVRRSNTVTSVLASSLARSRTIDGDSSKTWLVEAFADLVPIIERASFIADGGELADSTSLSTMLQTVLRLMMDTGYRVVYLEPDVERAQAFMRAIRQYYTVKDETHLWSHAASGRKLDGFSWSTGVTRCKQDVYLCVPKPKYARLVEFRCLDRNHPSFVNDVQTEAHTTHLETQINMHTYPSLVSLVTAEQKVLKVPDKLFESESVEVIGELIACREQVTARLDTEGVDGKTVALIETALNRLALFQLQRIAEKQLSLQTVERALRGEPDALAEQIEHAQKKLSVRSLLFGAPRKSALAHVVKAFHDRDDGTGTAKRVHQAALMTLAVGAMSAGGGGNVRGAYGTAAKQQIADDTYNGSVRGEEGSQGSLEKLAQNRGVSPEALGMSKAEAHRELISEGLQQDIDDCPRCKLPGKGKHNYRCVHTKFPNVDFTKFPGGWKSVQKSYDTNAGV